LAWTEPKAEAMNPSAAARSILSHCSAQPHSRIDWLRADGAHAETLAGSLVSNLVQTNSNRLNPVASLDATKPASVDAHEVRYRSRLVPSGAKREPDLGVMWRT